MSLRGDMHRITEGFRILANYDDDRAGEVTLGDHEIVAGPLIASEAGISLPDTVALENLGWRYDVDYDGWSYPL